MMVKYLIVANKEFLETYPLYRKFKTKRTFDLRHDYTFWTMEDVPKPPIHMHCFVCDSEQTFNMKNDYFDSHSEREEHIHGHVKTLNYLCTACSKGQRVFLVYFGSEKISEDKNLLYFEKVGQIPAMSIDMDNDLEKLLGEHADYYKKGLISESQGYGIGAFAYFRRITEEVIDELLESISELIPDSDKALYEHALEETKKTRVAQEKIDLVKDLLPLSLRPEDINPLSALHSALSEGMHSENDEDCLEYADTVKESLVYLIDQVMRAKRSSKSFTESMRKILEKKASKGKKDLSSAK